MKRFIIFSAVTGLLCLSGCSAELPSAAPDIDKAFTAEVKIKTGSELISGNVTRYGENNWEITFTEPFAVEGLTAVLDESGTRYEMDGFEAAADFSDEAASAVRLLAKGYDCAAKNTALYSECTFSASTELGSCTLTLDENHLPHALRLTDMNFYAELTEWAECDPAEAEEETDFTVE